MSVRSDTIEISTLGDTDIHDITDLVARAISKSGIKAGTVTVFCPSSTSALTTIEYEIGAVNDLKRLFEEIVPQNREYAHNARWQDGNGHSHVRGSLLGPSLTIPFMNGELTLGTWQQIIHIDFDNKPRKRELILQIVGE